MKKKLPIFIFIVLTAIPGFSQFNPGVTINLNSSVLKESRQIQVYSPPASKTGKQTYPVLYVFDAESLFLSAVSASEFMNYSSSLPQMPEAIIVGITNTDRNRDMPVPQEIAGTDGAKNFLDFISNELVPYINKQYPTNGLNVLIGHSQGGLFVTYAGLEQPKLFPFILALDAPMDVNPSLLKVYKEKFTGACTLNYFSAETKFGWGKDFSPPPGCKSYTRERIEGETHETMPYKGIYDGLKFLFREHIPLQKDMTADALKEYYDGLSKKYNCKYDIPVPVLLTATRQNIDQSKKEIALALIGLYEKTYGTDKQSAALLTKANAIRHGPDERVAFYLDHPPSSEEALKPFMGKWKGTLHVPGGTDLDITWEIEKLNDKYVMDARIMDQFDDISAFLVVTDKNELAWGRKQGRGGIYLSIGKLSVDGKTITGSEDMVGVQMPEGVSKPEPNTFEYKKIN